MPDPVARAYERGLELIEEGDYFAAHEALEEAWRAATTDDRDFFQGLVHVAVAWHHADVTGRELACERQLEKAARRLAPYRPSHRDLDVTDVLGQVAWAREAFPALPRPRFRRTRTPG
jgi:uncharacterized protein